MGIATETTPTLADLLARLGGIPANRVLLRPHPGTATEQDVIDIDTCEDRLCELVDGVLVEKTTGYAESALAVLLSFFLVGFVRLHRLGIVTGADGTLRLMPGLVRIPDVAFVSWDRLPHRKRPKGPIPDLVPDLAVEVLSKSNTAREMRRKLSEYFVAGVRLVWYIDAKARTVRVYTGPRESVLLKESETLAGGAVLPGFALPLRELFSPPEPIEPNGRRR
jgi:Uma2 family endonuclease